MYLADWKRTPVFELIPGLKNNKTVYFKQNIDNPELLDFWNFFIRFKKVRQLYAIFKENQKVNLISIDGKNVLETALDLEYLPLIKIVLAKKDLSLFLTKDDQGVIIFNRLWSLKFNIYKIILLFIKNNQLETFFSEKHMFSLIQSDIKKMIYFEKTFPGLFLKIYPYKIDNLYPEFQYVLLQHDILKKRLSQKFKPKNDKKVIFKI